MLSELKPCPKCHKRVHVWATRHGKVYVYCYHCNAEPPPDSACADTLPEAVAAWNRRAGEVEE